MTDVQKSLLEMLKEIDDICRKYHIEYYLGGGTFIGAVRHGGFLPWDDDADIHMSRENAQRFVEAVEAEKLLNRIVYAAPEDENSNLVHWRYENTESTAYLRALIGTSDPKGQFVDIFVNYPLPQNQKKRISSLEAFRVYCEFKACNFICRPFLSRKLFRKIVFLYHLERIVGRKRILRYFSKKAFECPDNNSESWLIRSPKLVKDEIPRALWGTPKYIPFENIMLPVAEQAEKLLNFSYGPAWFEVPAYAEKGKHVFFTDMDIPYSMYIQDIHKRFNAERFFQKEKEKKKYWLAILPERNEITPRLGALQGVCTALEVQDTIQANKIDLHLLIKERREKELRELFAPYFNRIQSQRFKYFGLYLDMPDEYLYAALYFQCFNGNYGQVKKILAQRRTYGDRELSEDLQRLCNICDATDALLTALYTDLDMEIARQLVDEWLVKEQTALYFQRADINLRLNGFGAEPDTELLCRCDHYLEQYPDDGELLKYRGDLLLRLGRNVEGERCYRKALCSLRNGFCIWAIKEYFAAKSLEAVG